MGSRSTQEFTVPAGLESLDSHCSELSQALMVSAELLTRYTHPEHCELSCGTVYSVLADRSCFIWQVPKQNKTKPPNNNKNVVTSSKNY